MKVPAATSRLYSDHTVLSQQARVATVVARAVTPGTWSTTGGTPRRYRHLDVHPRVVHEGLQRLPQTTCSADRQRSASAVRTDPRRRAVVGMTLAASPVCSAPKTRCRRRSSSSSLALSSPPTTSSGNRAAIRAAWRNQVDRELRSRRVPTRAPQLDLDDVGRSGQRPRPDAHPSHVELGIRVHPVDDPDVVERAVGDDRHGAAGHGLLGRLEHQADAADPVLGQRQSGAQHDGGVQVVAAAVRDPGHRGPVRRRRGVVHGEGVDVAAQGDPGATRRTQVADQAGASNT